jgi:hypothetical protein
MIRLWVADLHFNPTTLLRFPNELFGFSHALIDVFLFSIYKVTVLFKQYFDHITPALCFALIVI